MERPNPSPTVFNLQGGQPFQQQGASRFPEPQFGGFRPVKRHLSEDTLLERIGEDDYRDELGSRQDQPRHRKFQRNRGAHADAAAILQHGKSTNQTPKLRAQDHQVARLKAQEKLRSELTKVYDEEYSDLDNDVLDPEYEYYYEYLE